MILKVGGSVADRLAEIADAIKYADEVIIVPGGWVFANIVRKIDREFKLSPTTAHWMAVASMNIYGYFIAELLDVPLIEPANFDELQNVGTAVVILPYLLLRKHDELPHSWDVTSDSIAIWLAAKLKREVVKVTAAGGIIKNGVIMERIKAAEITPEIDVIDSYSPQLLMKYGLNMFICGVEELKNYIVRGRAKGTLIEWR